MGGGSSDASDWRSSLDSWAVCGNVVVRRVESAAGAGESVIVIAN